VNELREEEKELFGDYDWGLSEGDKRIIHEWLVPELWGKDWKYDDPLMAEYRNRWGSIRYVNLPLFSYDTLHTEIRRQLKRERTWISFHGSWSDLWCIGTLDDMWVAKNPYQMIAKYLKGRWYGEAQPVSGS